METLRSLREALLVLHKTLLDAERLSYERAHGRQTAAAFLHAVVHDETLGWLRPFAALIVRIDQLLALPPEQTDGGEVDACIDEARTLVRLPVPTVDGTQARYAALLQQSPDVVLAHGRLLRTLPT